jgi:hypothetical protein
MRPGLFTRPLVLLPYHMRKRVCSLVDFNKVGFDRRTLYRKLERSE